MVIGNGAINTQPTRPAELNNVLQAFVDGVRSILGDNFVGAYLQGSWAVGDADASSDVDFLFVVNTDVPEAQVPALQAVHVQVYALAASYLLMHTARLEALE